MGQLANTWMAVDENVPEFETEVLVFEDSEMSVGVFEKDNRWYGIDSRNLYPTHWMYLPAEPKK